MPRTKERSHAREARLEFNCQPVDQRFAARCNKRLDNGTGKLQQEIHRLRGLASTAINLCFENTRRIKTESNYVVSQPDVSALSPLQPSSNKVNRGYEPGNSWKRSLDVFLQPTHVHRNDIFNILSRKNGWQISFPFFFLTKLRRMMHRLFYYLASNHGKHQEYRFNGPILQRSESRMIYYRLLRNIRHLSSRPYTYIYADSYAECFRWKWTRQFPHRVKFLVRIYVFSSFRLCVTFRWTCSAGCNPQ